LLAILPLARKFSGFDAAIAFSGDVDGESRVLEAVADSIGNDRIADDFAPVIERQLGSEQDGFVDRSFFEQLAQILGFGGRETAARRPPFNTVCSTDCGLWFRLAAAA
jgi:hypothetical protein